MHGSRQDVSVCVGHCEMSYSRTEKDQQMKSCKGHLQKHIAHVFVEQKEKVKTSAVIALYAGVSWCNGHYSDKHESCPRQKESVQVVFFRQELLQNIRECCFDHGSN